MTITRIALVKAQALPSTIDERLAKIRKASLTRQKKSRDSPSCFGFSFCVSIAIILWAGPRKARKQRLSVTAQWLELIATGTPKGFIYLAATLITDFANLVSFLSVSDSSFK